MPHNTRALAAVPVAATLLLVALATPALASSGGGLPWEGPLQQVIGDIGKDIAIGQNKTVIWNVLIEKDQFIGDWVFGFEVKNTKFDFFIDEKNVLFLIDRMLG